ncbi:MAG: arginase family protein, partial [Pseudomonadales bacterium]|nr:arginase family protein [Pseudomonadales bacterium]
KLSQRCNQIGLSIDMDAIDPRDAPAVATPVANGIRGEALLYALSKALQNTQICGLEISEYVPIKDPDQRTLKLMSKLIKTVYPSSENKFLGSFNSGIKSIS